MADHYEVLGVAPDAIVYQAVGCDECNRTGFRGRIGVYEAVRVDAAVRRLINEGGDEDAIARHAFAAARLFFPHWDQGLADELIAEFQLPMKQTIKKLSRGQLSAVGVIIGLLLSR